MPACPAVTKATTAGAWGGKRHFGGSLAEAEQKFSRPQVDSCPGPARAALLSMGHVAERDTGTAPERTGRAVHTHVFHANPCSRHPSPGPRWHRALPSGLRLGAAAWQLPKQACERRPALLTSAPGRRFGAAVPRALARGGGSRGAAAAVGAVGGGLELQRVLLAAAASAGAITEAPSAGQGIIGGRGGDPAGRG